MLTAHDFAGGIRAFAEGADRIDHRHNRKRSREAAETVLMQRVVALLRIATGARGAVPRGGHPCYDVAAAFLHCAGYSRQIDAAVIKNRLEARTRGRDSPYYWTRR